MSDKKKPAAQEKLVAEVMKAQTMAELRVVVPEDPKKRSPELNTAVRQRTDEILRAANVPM